MTRRKAVVLTLAGWLTAGLMRAWVPLAGEVWPDGRVAIAIDLEGTAPAGSSGDWNAAASEAMMLWNAKLQRVQLTEVPREAPAWYENGRNELFFDRNMFDEPFPSGVLAVAGATYDRGVRVETDVVFNANLRWSVYRGTLQNSAYDLRRVAVHELGHLLGLDHPDEDGQSVTAVMNSRVSDVEGPTADDESGARALYDFGAGAAPVMITQPKAAEIVQGAIAKLTVSAGGRGPLTYEWRRDGLVVAGATAQTLRFNAELGNAGEYSVVVRNAGGALTSKPARLAVRAALPPSVSSETSSQSITAGSDLVLSAFVSRGDAPFHLEWKKNGVIVPEADTARLPLKDAQFSDAGDYTLTAANVAGSATTSIIRIAVTPGRPPRFMGELASSAVATGGAISLSAPGDASGPISYQWQKDGVDISGATDSSFSIGRFRQADVGRYTVTMSNAFGRVTSNAGELTSLDPAPLTITRQPVAVTEQAGANVGFTVETDVPVTIYRWFKDGTPLAGQISRLTGEQTRTFTVSSVSAGNIGSYSVEVSDGRNVVRSRGAKLTVLTAGEPVIVQHPSTHTVPVGTRVNLSVTLRAGQAANYQWFKDDQPVSFGTSATLEFTAKTTDAGRYRVRVMSLTGVIESELAEVVIVPIPGLFHAHPPSELYELGTESLRLSALAAELAFRRGLRSNPTYFFTRNGQRILGHPFSEANLAGTYTLTIGNGTATETSRPFTLGYVALGRPVINRHPQGAAVLVGDAVSMGVVATPNVDLRYQWYRNGAALGGATRSEWSIPFFGAADAGDYTVVVSNSLGTTSSEPGTLEIRGLQTPIIQQHPLSTTVVAGQTISLNVFTRRGEFRYQWFKGNQPIRDANSGQLNFSASSGSAGAYAVTVTDGTVSATSRTAQVTVLAASRAPAILFQPASEAAPQGGDVTLSVGADGAPLPDRYQWRKDGVDIPGATDAKLRMRGVQVGAAGDYTVVVTNTIGSVTSQPARITIDAAGRLINLATRAAVGRGGDILIAGFVISGREPRTVLLRGIGDQLSEFGVSGVLRDPVVSLFDSKGKQLARNDDWFRTGDENMLALQKAARQAGAFPQRGDARDGALLMTLAPGSYTAQVSGLAETTGVALLEIYEIGKPAKERLINLSSRAVVGTGANILIPGLVLDGQTPRRLLIRAVGPGLADFGIGGALSDPIMNVYRGTEAIAQNDNWGDQLGAALSPATMAVVGAFPLKSGSRDAVLLLDLPPGSYTVQVSGVRESTGIALVEVYEVAP